MPPWEKYQGTSDTGGPWTKYGGEGADEEPQQERGARSLKDMTAGEIASDVGKSLGVGAARGLIGGTWALPGNLVEMADTAGDWLSQTFDSPEQQEAYQKRKYKNFLPTTESTQKHLESVTGPWHKPESIAGEFAETGASFLADPTSYIGGGGFWRKVAGAVGGALSSETAGQTARAIDPEYEGAARFIGGVAGGGVAGKEPKKRGITADALEAAKDAKYNQLQNMGLAIDGNEYVRQFGSHMPKLTADSYTRGLAGDTWRETGDFLRSLVDRHASAQAGHTVFRDVTVQDLQTFEGRMNRVRQKNISSNPTDAAAAGELLSMHDAFLDSVNPTAVKSGNLQQARDLWNEAKADYRGLKRSDAVSMSLDRAERQAMKSGYGGNKENTIRQRLDALLNNKTEMKKFSPEERKVLDDLVRGGLTQNALRHLGKLAPTGPVSAIWAILAGHGDLGHALALGAVPYAAKKASEQWMKNKTQSFAEQLRNQTPSGKLVAPPPQPLRKTAPLVRSGIVEQSTSPIESEDMLQDAAGDPLNAREPLRFTVHPR